MVVHRLIHKKFIHALWTLIIVVGILSGCGSHDNQELPEANNSISVSPDESTDNTDLDEQVMIHIGRQPGGEMSLEEFEAATVSYNAYYSGVVEDVKTGEQVKLSDEDYKTVEDFCNSVIKGRTRISKDNGADLPSFNVTVYNENGKAYELNTRSDGWIEGTDEVIRIITSCFEDKPEEP